MMTDSIVTIIAIIYHRNIIFIIHSSILIELMTTSVLFNQVQYQLRQNDVICQLFVALKL